MTRLLLSSVAAIVLLAAAPVSASAATHHRTIHHPMMHRHAAAKPAMHGHGRMARGPVRNDSGSAAVDALNEQSLAKARAGQ